jgi:hypothetical protein
MIRRLLPPAFLFLLTLGACASDEPGGPGHGGKPGGPPPIRLFISPSGEPFRGEGGLARWFAQVDTDHDGSITLEEFRADARQSFKVLDLNGDGTIDGIELQHYEHDVVPEIGIMTFDEPGGGQRRGSGGSGGGGGRRGGGGGGRGGGGQTGTARDPEQMLKDQSSRPPPGAGRDGAARYSLLNEPEPISAADADVDGKVTLAEWMAQTDRRFAKLDHLKTGRLTLDSLLKVQPKEQKTPPPKAPKP